MANTASSISPLLEHDLAILSSTGQIVGIDEAGRGALAGPVVAAAIALEESFYNGLWCRQRANEVNDSKQLTPAKRESLFTQITQLKERNELCYAVGIASVSEIEKLNILGATKLAMQRALENLENYLEDGILERHATDAPLFDPLPSVRPASATKSLSSFSGGIFPSPTPPQSETSEKNIAELERLRSTVEKITSFASGSFTPSTPVIISGSKIESSSAIQTEKNSGHARVLVDGLPLKGFPFRHQAIVHGDARSLSIAMASIIAKVTRDRIMDGLDIKLPLYGFAEHKGYATRRHRAAIKEVGVSTEHRPSFLKKLRAGEAPLMEFIFSCEDKLS